MAEITGQLRVKMWDGGHVPYTVPFDIATSSGLIADTGLAVAAFLPLLDAVTQDQIIKADLAFDYVLPGGLKATPVSGSNNAVGALLNYNSAVFGEHASIWVPNWIPAGYRPTIPAAVFTDDAGPVAAFLARLLAATNNTTFTDEDSNNLTLLINAIKSERKQRKALKKLRQV